MALLHCFLWASNSPLYILIFTTFLYALLCWWTFRLLPYLGYYKTVLQWTLGCLYLFELEFPDFPDICPGVGLLDHVATLFLIFWGTSTLFSTAAALIYVLTNSIRGLPFLHIFSSIYHLYFLMVAYTCMSIDSNHITLFPSLWFSIPFPSQIHTKVWYFWKSLCIPFIILLSV